MMADTSVVINRNSYIPHNILPKLLLLWLFQKAPTRALAQLCTAHALKVKLMSQIGWGAVLYNQSSLLSFHR